MATSTEATNNAHASWIDTPPLSPPLRHWSDEAVEKQNWLDRLADPLQNWVRSLSASPSMKKFKDGLHGTWLGHPLHPVLTDVPIGSWTSTMLLDCVWLTSDHPQMARAADITLIFGLLGAGGAAVARTGERRSMRSANFASAAASSMADSRRTSRCASRVCWTPPNAASATRRASLGDSPARMFFSVSSSM